MNPWAGGSIHAAGSKGMPQGFKDSRMVLGQAYLSIIGDGTRLFTGQHFNSRFVSALESNDTAWAELNQQDFDEGPFEMAIDPINDILYSANIRAGVFALKLK
jgi:hypothetical protein